MLSAFVCAHTYIAQVMESPPIVEAHVIQWVECSRCQKWRIIPPMDDGSEETIPDVWFCEMNRDVKHNSCDASEEEYKAPVEVPLEPLRFGQVTSAVKRVAKINDPESIRARLRQLTTEELEAAFSSLDLDLLFKEEFGDNLASAKSKEWVPGHAESKHHSKQQRTSTGRTDHAGLNREVAAAMHAGKSILPPGIASQFTRRFS